MPSELLSITEKAIEFLHKSGHVFPRLVRSRFDSDKKAWLLIFDVGLAKQDLRTIAIDDATGKVLSVE